LRIINSCECKEFFDRIYRRQTTQRCQVTQEVAKIIEDVRLRKDDALKDYTQRYDGVTISNFTVTRAEIDNSLNQVDSELISALQNAKHNIEAFHKRQLSNSFFETKPSGAIVGQTVRALQRVGMYAPNGRAAYPSSVLMNAIPAAIAGVDELVLCTPPERNGKANSVILAAAAICGVKDVYLVGGAQAVAAMAYGTETIGKVDKIVGPGSDYVAAAKRLVYGDVDIDMIAGPSEILIIADKTANPVFAAADLMGQAEHDPNASAVMLTTCEILADNTLKEIERQLSGMSRKEIIKRSFESFGAIILCGDETEMVDLANELAPEHLEIMVESPLRLLGTIKNAGSIFLGDYSPEPIGDYYAGPNHVLPTGRTARFFSPLGVPSFQKRSSFIYYTYNALARDAADVIKIANNEGLTAHANALEVRIK
jgi:histidinol dehydrogenase